MPLFIKALLIFLLIKRPRHPNTHAQTQTPHSHTVEWRDSVFSLGWYIVTGGGTEPVGGIVALQGTVWHQAKAALDL